MTEGSHFVLQDLGSTNGTFINEVRVKEAYLTAGCLIEIGNVKIRFQSVDEEVVIQPSEEDRFGDIIGVNVQMRKIFGILNKIAPTDTSVIIEGEPEQVKKSLRRQSTKSLSERISPSSYLTVLRYPRI